MRKNRERLCQLASASTIAILSGFGSISSIAQDSRSFSSDWMQRQEMTALDGNNAAWTAPSRTGQLDTGSTSRSNNSSVAATDSRLASSISSSPASELTKPIFWNKPEFVIPFNVSSQGRLPAAVELEVSTDAGRNWVAVQRSDISERQFAFRSRGDGMYWFRIKTIDSAGKSFETSAQPLAIIIDTNRPEIDLVVDSDEQARMTADFRIADANLSGTDMRLEYQTELDAQWVPVQMQSQFGRDSTEIVGKGIWEVPVRARQLVVRLIVRDSAGNESEITRLPSLLRTANSGGGLQLASGGKSIFNQMFPAQQITDPTQSPSLMSPQSSINIAPPQQRQPTSLVGTGDAFSRSSNQMETLPSPPPLARSGINRSQSNSESTLILNGPTDAPSGNLSIGSSNQPGLSNGVSRYVFSEIEAAAANNASQQIGGRSNVPSSPTINLPNSQLANKPLPFESLPTNIAPGAPQIDTVVRNPAENFSSRGKLPFASNSRAFSLDYDVETDAGNQVAGIELWGTIDGGRNWTAWGSDPDKRSPFDIKVQNDGLFGFRMVVVGSNGLTNNRPLAGDDADAWIEVDTVLPSARIISAQYGSGNEAGSLIIEYNASDERLAERPIALSYSPAPDGPWTAIISELPNSGRFAWPGNPNLPRRVYLRLDAFDRAGNVAVDRMEFPVDLEGLTPRGRIQGFRPIPAN